MIGAKCRKCNSRMESIGVTETNEIVFQCSVCRTVFTISFSGQWKEYPMETPDDMKKFGREVKMRKTSFININKQAS